MSIDPARLRVYLSPPLACPYLPARIEQRLLVPLDATPALAAEQLDFFTKLGFRRSQNFVYRPHCGYCRACVSLRLPVARFAPDRTQRRIAARNSDLQWAELPPARAAQCLYPLFKAYQDARHAGGEMAQFSPEEFARLADSGPAAACFALSLDGRVVGATLCDRTPAGLSAIYSLYDPYLEKRSLGTELILRLIAQARAEALPHVYLGYWIEDCRKMSYKARFRPAEVLTGNGWTDA